MKRSRFALQNAWQKDKYDTECTGNVNPPLKSSRIENMLIQRKHDFILQKLVLKGDLSLCAEIEKGGRIYSKPVS